MNLKHKTCGFSLIELMVVISIVTLLTMLSTAYIRGFVARAKETEGGLNVKLLYALMQSYYFDENSPFMGTQLSYVSLNNYSSPTSCHMPLGNPFGFRLNDCQKISYMYVYSTRTDTKTMGAVAVEGSSDKGKRIYNFCCGSSLWVASSGGVHHSVSPSNMEDCKVTLYNKVWSENGSTNAAFDFDGNGVVNSSLDTTLPAWLTTIPASVLGNRMSHMNVCP